MMNRQTCYGDKRATILHGPSSDPQASLTTSPPLLSHHLQMQATFHPCLHLLPLLMPYAKASPLCLLPTSACPLAPAFLVAHPSQLVFSCCSTRLYTQRPSASTSKAWKGWILTLARAPTASVLTAAGCLLIEFQTQTTGYRAGAQCR